MKLSKGDVIEIIEKLRLIESEIFKIASKYNVSSVEELDKLIEKGKLEEKLVGEDLFLLDYLIEEKEKLEKRLAKAKIKKELIWENLQNLLELPKLSFQI